MERVTQRGLWFLFGLLLVLSVMLLTVVAPFLAYVFYALFAAFLVWPFYVRLERRFRPRPSAALLVVFVYAVLFVPVILLVVSIAADLVSVASAVARVGPENIILAILGGFISPDLAERASEFVARAMWELASRVATGAIPFALQLLLGFFIFGFVLFHSLIYGRSIVGFLRNLVPLRPFRIDALFESAGRSLNAVFYSVLLVAAIQGGAGGLVWWLTGLPNPFFFGAVMFVLSILPFAGPSFVLVPAGILKIMDGELFLGIVLISSGVVFVGGIDNVMRPVLVSRFGRTNPALVVVGLAGGVVAFGIVGLALGPLLFVLWVAVAKQLAEEMNQWKMDKFGPTSSPSGEGLSQDPYPPGLGES